MRDYNVRINLIPFYVTDILVTELKSYNICAKNLRKHMKNDIPSILDHLHISDPNLL